MKTLTCKTVMTEVDELDRDLQPSSAAKEHMRQCQSCRSFADDRIKLREFVGGLGAVNAPADFDFRLRARLATERGSSSSASPRVFGFGLPSVALAMLALMIGVGFLVRSQLGTIGDPTVAKNDNPSVTNQPSGTSKIGQPATVVQPQDDGKPSEVETPDLSELPSDKLPVAINQTTKQRTNRLRGSNRTAVKREELLAGSETVAMFPLESAEPLRVSVDYAAGGSRTISLPAVSFGSQQVLSRNASLMRTSARTVW